MPHYPKLVGPRCYLSPAAPEDAEWWARWDNDLDITLPLGDEAYNLTALDKEQNWIQQAAKNSEPVFTIINRADEQPIGRCLLFSLDWVNRSAMFGILIGEKAVWGQGFGDEATRLLLDYAFRLLNLNNIMLGVFAFNQRAIRLYQKLGFKEIGRRRQARIIAGQAYDVVLMDLLAEEFTGSLLSLENITRQTRQ